MNIRDYDMDNFVTYCREYNHSDVEFRADEYDLLRFWEKAKNEYLSTLMGNELILERDFSYERKEEELYDELEAMVSSHHKFFNSLRDQLEKALGAKTSPATYCLEYPTENNKIFCRTVMSWCGADNLIDNRVVDKIQCVIDGKTIKINAGEKIMRAMRKICMILKDAGYPSLLDEFEEFRLAHSRVFNQKTVTGKLCLSIHPLDYATASDNANGWSSCMSWYEEGCYRLGTVEMMNSPMVICAYLKSDVQEMFFGNDCVWPSKKWRAWIVVNKDAILCNRNYPYQNDDLSKACIAWVAELAKKNLGWDFYDNIQSTKDWYDNTGIELDYDTNFMYNDFTNALFATVRVNLEPRYYNINYSGVANCMNCGMEICFNGDQDSSTLCCADCRDIQFCSDCGCVITEENYYYGPNDELLCCDCYSNNVVHDNVCDCDIYANEAVHAQIPVDRNLYSELTGNDEWSAPYCEEYICKECAEEMNISFLPNDITLPSNNWTLSRWNQDDLVDPRKTSVSVFYRLLGYKVDKNGEPRTDWARDEIKRLHINDLWENYRKCVVELLGEAD